jgi:Putative adhesin
MNRVICRSLTLVMGLLAAATVVATASEQGSFERTYQVSGAVELQVLTRSGDVTVRSGPARTVTVRGKIHVGERWFGGDRQAEVTAIEKNPPIQQSGNSIHIDYVNAHEISVDYEITAPADTAVTTHSGSGDQRMEGLRGNIKLESGSGDMRLDDISGDIQVHTGSGNVTAHEIAGPFSAEAGSGDIRAEEKGKGDVQVHTGSGNVELRGVDGMLDAHTGSGDVTIQGTNSGRWEIRTSSGNVDLELPSGSGFDLDASAGSGSVTVDRPVTMVVQGDLRRAQHEIRGKVSGGGPELLVHTGSGDVRIH